MVNSIWSSMAKFAPHAWLALSEKALTKFGFELASRLTISAVYIALFVVYSALRLANLFVIEEVRQFPDTPVYTAIASLSFWNPHFWVGPRPWTVPLFYKLLGNHPTSIALFQLSLSIISWGLLAFFVARAVRLSRLKPIVFGIILLFSLSAEIILWDGIMLCDSISLSLMALFIAGWLWLLEGWDLRKVALVVTLAFLWSFTYDTNAWVVLMIAAILLAGAAARRIQGRYVLIASVFAVIFAMNDVSANRARRWVVAFMNNVGMRILPSPEKTAYFAELGMPVTPALMQRTEKKAWSDNWAFFKDPALQQFRDWLYTYGKSSYLRFLLSHPSITTLEPLRHPEDLLAPELTPYAPVGFSPMLRGVFAEIIYPKKWPLPWVWAAAIVLGLTIGLRTWRYNNAFLVPLGLILLVYPHATLIWHGDPNEIGRHALQVGVYFRLALWILLLLAADALLARVTV